MNIFAVLYQMDRTTTFRFLLRNSGFLCLGWTLLAGSCNTTEPPPPPPPEPQPTISVSFEDASCVELWLKVSVTDAISPHTVALVRDSMLLMSAEFTANDTVLVDEGLAPNRTYRYAALLLNDSTTLAISPVTTARTLDSTSHTFTWQIDTIGDNALLYDVAIINDTLAYAVGEIYKRDSLGNWDPLPYNLVVWNGLQWELKRVTVPFRGSPVTVPLEGIFAHSATDIWLAGSIPIHGDGTNWIGYDIQMLVGAGATVSRMWGTPAEMYFVGRAGNIIHYNGTSWTRLKSGTTLDVQDVLGSPDSKTGMDEIIAVASDRISGAGKALFRITDTGVSNLDVVGLASRLSALWFRAGKRYYIVGAGIHQKRRLQDSVWVAYPPGVVTTYGSTSIHGTGFNDIVVGGSFGELVHFNGVTWRKYDEVALPGGVYAGVRMRGNTIFAVGDDSFRGILLRGTRQ